YITLAHHSTHCVIINDTSPSDINTHSLHDALPISIYRVKKINKAQFIVFFNKKRGVMTMTITVYAKSGCPQCVFAKKYLEAKEIDRKSTRLNSSHVSISYAVFCLKKKNNKANNIYI